MMHSVIEIWNFFLPFLKPQQRKLIMLLTLPIIWCLSETIVPYLIKLIIDNLVLIYPEAEKRNFLITLGLMYVLLVFLLEFSIRACNYLWIKIFPKVRANVQSTVLELIQAQPLQFLCGQFTGDLLSKYQNLSNGFERAFRIFLYGFYPTLLSFFFALLFISFISVTFSIVFFCWFLAMNLVTFLFFDKIILAARKQSQIQNHLVGYVGNFISNAVTMIAFPRTLSEQAEFCRLIQEDTLSTEKLEFVTFKADIWRSVASWLLLVSMIAFLIFGWQRSWVTLGDFSFIAAICFYTRRTIWMAALQFSEFFKELGVIKEALLLVSDVSLDLKDTIKTQDNTPIFPKVSIDFQNVCFGYTKDKLLFSDLTLRIPAGQRLGIAGNSGVGKTSLVQVLLRLYDPTQGTIKINGQDYKSFNLKELRNLISYVPQNASLFHCSIFENIAFGKLDASKDEVYEAAHVCLCDEFISSLERGYDTVVGEGGYKISGGQRQRIAIARAYIKKAPIFILDEALTGLESTLKEQLLQHLCKYLQAHTIILISHSESDLLKMDRVVTLSQDSVILGNFSSKIMNQSTGQEKLIVM